MKSFLLAISILAATVWLGGNPLLAEEPYVQWAKTPSAYGFLTSDRNGGVWTSPWGALVHLNARGETTSSNQLAGAWAHVDDVDRAGSQYWAGSVYTNGTFDFPQVRGFFVAKVNPSGQFVWVRNNQMPEVYGGDDSSLTSGYVKADNNGNVVVAGYTKGPFKMQSLEWDGEQAPFAFKLDPNGNVLWGRKVACTFADQSRGVNNSAGTPAVDFAGNIYVAGWVRAGTADFGGITVYPGAEWQPDGNWGDYFVAKYTPDGQLLWVTLGYGYVPYGSSLAVGQQGEVYAAFVRFSSQPQQWGVARLGPDGTVLWEKALSPAMSDWFHLAVDPLGQPVFAGAFSGTLQLDGITLRSRTPDYPDIVVAKTDTSGHTLWAIAGGGSSWDGAGNLVCDAQGDIIVEGSSATSATFDGWLLRGEFLAKISEKPSLALARTVQGVQLTWPAKATNYVLEATTSLPAVSWTTVTNAPTVVGRDRNLQLPAAGNAKFFRLRRP